MKNILSFKLFEMYGEDPIDKIDEFIKEFDSCESWYDTNDYWFKGVFNPPFKTDPNFLSKVVDKINDLNINGYSDFNFKNIKVTDENIDEIFNECVNFINWWNVYVKENIERDLNTALKSGKLKTEQDAKDIAIKYLTDDIVSYKPTTYISNHLPKNVKKIIRENEYKHPWFQDVVKHTIFEDGYGRIWNRTMGKIKDDVKLRKSDTYGYFIDKLGGGMWSSQDGINFKCEYRTNMEEVNSNGAKPETFVG